MRLWQCNDMNQLKSVALVTGASRGIGSEIARRLVRDGYYVFINYSSSQKNADQLVNELNEQSGIEASQSIGFDVANAEQVTAAFDVIQKKCTDLSLPFSVLVNNAGISIDSLVLRLKPEDLQKVISTNLSGAIYCAKEAARLMMKARAGSIIQISSVVGEMGNAGQVAYSAAKAGMIGFTKSLARELASRNICVNCVTPGYIKTEMTDALSESQQKAITDNIPLGRLGAATDVANCVSFLASDESRYITGQVLGVNGGLYI